MEADKTSNRKISRFDAVIPFLYRSILRRERKKKKKARNHEITFITIILLETPRIYYFPFLARRVSSLEECRASIVSLG